MRGGAKGLASPSGSGHPRDHDVALVLAECIVIHSSVIIHYQSMMSVLRLFMTGVSSPSCASAQRRSEANLAAVRSALHRLTAGQFEELQARWADGRALRGRVVVGIERIPESLLNHLLHLPASTLTEALAEEALARQCIARLLECIEDYGRAPLQGTEGLVQYIASAPAAEVEERLAVALEVVRTASAWDSGCGFLELFGRQISRLPDLSPFKDLVTIDLSDCSSLMDVEGLRDLPRLECLHLALCTRLTNLDGLRNLPGLQDLDLTRCEALATLDGLQNLRGLRSVKIGYCTSLSQLNGLAELPDLESVDLTGCTSLNDIKGLWDLPNLAVVNLTGCTGLTSCSLDELRHRLPCDCAVTGPEHP